jgi:hypothetical protein
MRRWSVILELPTQQDIAQARSWLAEHDLEATERWFKSIYDTIGSLETSPDRCPLASESKSFQTEIREIFHGRRQHKYRILFTMTEKEGRVLHVRHGARLALGEIEMSEE